MSALQPFAGIIARLVAQRVQTRQFLPAHLICDPVWDAMLDLAHSEAIGYRVQVTALAANANVPPTTMLRHIAVMQDSGLIQREPDPSDRRRSWLTLTERGRAAMLQTIAAIAAREPSHV